MMGCTRSTVAVLLFILTINKVSSQGDTFSNCINEIGSIGCDAASTVRRYDGRCNNLNNPTWGAMNTKLLRLVAAEYADNQGTPRGFGINPDIPSANEVSGALFKSNENDDDRSVWTVMFMTFGQFLDHDMTLATHLSSSDCRITDCASPSSFNYPCFPIKFGKDTNRCTPLSRANPVCKGPGETSPRDQINELTAYIDASQIYGNTEKVNKKLRTNDGTGRLRLLHNDLLPLDPTIDSCPIRGGCSLVGDVRGDENIALHAMQTVWAREHNRIAGELKKNHPDWAEKLLFQTARKINTAQFQHIVYNEYIKTLVLNLSPHSGYDHNVNPSISNAFATAAFRYGHSLIPNHFVQFDASFKKKYEPIELRNAFETRVTIDERGIEPTMFGLIGKHSNNVDTGFADGVARHLMRPAGQNEHRDLTAFNIQRGRDHGIPTYGKWREFCRLPTLNSFDDLKGIMRDEAIAGLRKLGQSVNDLDLFAAGISEKNLPKSAVGPTFACIMKDQFERLRDGDRFYYEHSGVFKRHELQAIKRTSFARVLCDNVKGMTSVHRDVFRFRKIRISCSRIPGMNLAVF